MWKNWLLTLVPIVSAPAFCATATAADEERVIIATEQGAAPATADEGFNPSWLEEGHTYATDQVQALTVWMDNFFGVPNYELEKAESLVRLVWHNSFDEEDDYNTKFRIRGKLQMPRISKRLNLFFSGEDGDTLGADERENEDQVGVQYTLGELDRSRVDLTLGWGGGDLRPGVRYRNQGPIGEFSGYRFTQRLQYESSEGFFTTSEANLDRVVTDNTLFRWNNRVRYGEETEGAEWRSQIGLGDRHRDKDQEDQLVVAYFASVKGVTDPSYVENYRLGMVFRRQLNSRFLFAELEPSYNWRQDDDGESRYGAWNVVLRFELLLERDRSQPRAAKATAADAATATQDPTDSLPQTRPGESVLFR